jgi:hypothetical protein
MPNIKVSTTPTTGVPYDAAACKKQCSAQYGQQMLTGDSSGWYQCTVACDVPPSSGGKAPLNIDAPAYVKPGAAATATAAPSMFAKIGTALQLALAPKQPIPSSDAVHLVMPGVSAPTSAKPVVTPVLQVSSTSRQLVLPTSAANTSTYGAKPALTI